MDHHADNQRDTGMRLSLAAGLAGLLGLAWPASPARALQFEPVPVSATEMILGGHGPIVKGDAARLEQALAALPQGRRLLALALDSPGGLVGEERLGNAGHRQRVGQPGDHGQRQHDDDGGTYFAKHLRTPG